jgi:glycosyltransferase involved in cell wall biosynthesis
MKRILIFSVAYEPFVGGAEVAIKEITARIAEVEFDLVTVNIDGKQKSRERIGNVNIVRVGRGMWGKLLFPITAVWAMRKGKYDIAWAMMANYAGFAAVLYSYLHPRVRYVLTLQEGDPIEFIHKKVRFVKPFWKKIFSRAHVIQTISKFLADFAVAEGARVKPVVIPNGVDIELFTKPVGELVRDSLAATYGKKEGDIFLITTSRLVEKNAVGDVIAALALLPEHVSFLVVGEGKLEAELRLQAERLGVATRVHFVGFVPYERIPAYLSISDIFIRPSLSEGMGNSFIEAMAAGLPVVATPVGGIPDFLIDKKTGVFCEPKNPQSVATAVRALLNDEQLRISCARTAFELARSYDWRIISDRMKKEIFLLG